MRPEWGSEREEEGDLMAGKRGNNEGSLSKRSDGRWMARLMLPDGSRKTFYAKTRQEASRRLAAALRDRDAGLPVVGERQTVEQYLRQWLEDIKPALRLSSWLSREMLVRVHVLPTLGTTVLSRLTPQQLQSLYVAKLAEGLAPGTVRLLHAIIRTALAHATRVGLLQRNVAGLVRAPRPTRKDMRVFTPEQARQFLAAVAGDPLEALYVLALTTGMRRGELLALHWTEVDLDAGFVQVRYTLQHLREGQYVFMPPKTERSRRKVALSVLAVEALRRHQARQAVQHQAAAEAWCEEGLVFPGPAGRAIRGANLVQERFVPLLERVGLPSLRFHDLRHTAATLLLLQGIHPKIVSEMLGHSTVSMTLDIYSHVLPDMQREATAAFDHLLTEQ
jgi:integrase